jgi:hypothetical protein
MIDDVTPLSPAQRMRRYRHRRRQGHTCITVELRESEISALISCGYADVATIARCTELCMGLLYGERIGSVIYELRKK